MCVMMCDGACDGVCVMVCVRDGVMVCLWWCDGV